MTFFFLAFCPVVILLEVFVSGPNVESRIHICTSRGMRRIAVDVKKSMQKEDDGFLLDNRLVTVCNESCIYIYDLT